MGSGLFAIFNVDEVVLFDGFVVFHNRLGYVCIVVCMMMMIMIDIRMGFCFSGDV